MFKYILGTGICLNRWSIIRFLKMPVYYNFVGQRCFRLFNSYFTCAEKKPVSFPPSYTHVSYMYTILFYISICPKQQTITNLFRRQNTWIFLAVLSSILLFIFCCCGEYLLYFFSRHFWLYTVQENPKKGQQSAGINTIQKSDIIEFSEYENF